jgi:MFS transporter, DHA3 family, macrolide efflux protein
MSDRQTPPAANRPTGMRAFTVIWIGQLVSLLGSSMTGFALPIWVFQKTGRVEETALLGLAFMLPLIIMSPIAGAIVDRSNRKLMMMLSDLAAGATTVIVLILLATNNLEIWHLYITNAIAGAFQTFQWPAYSAAISLMLSKEQYGRANGLMDLAGAGSNIFAPVLAGALLGIIGLEGLLIIDIVTFVFAVSTLAFVHIPQPPITEAGREAQGSIWREAAFGFRYILRRPSLLGLQLVFFSANFLSALGFTVLAPMILARTGNNELVFGSAQSAGAVGGVVGAMVMSAWGGPKKRVHGVLLGWAISSLLGTVIIGLGRSLPVWAVGLFFTAFFVPIINGSNQSIWQAKVAPDLQGRVFSIRRLIAWVTSPVANLVAIPLADDILGPAMMPDGRLADTFGWLVGTGPGAGMSLILVVSGLLTVGVGLAGYLFPIIRHAEELLPDHEAVMKETPPAETVPA